MKVRALSFLESRVDLVFPAECIERGGVILAGQLRRVPVEDLRVCVVFLVVKTQEFCPVVQ